MSQAMLARKRESDCEECKTRVRRKPAGPQLDENEIPSIVHHVLNSPGQPLDRTTRAFFEPRFCHDFSRVRVHTDAKAAESARAINAQAYSAGTEVVFDTGRYAPETLQGKRLLAHELTHVLQQANGTAPSAGKGFRIGAADGPEEREAGSSADGVSSNRQLVAASPLLANYGQGLVQRQPNLPGPAPVVGQWNLSVDERGRLDITAAGPATTPIVTSPTIGIRRDANGQLHLLVGGKDKVISIDEIPALLRQSLGGRGAGSGTKPKFQVPTCAQLTLHAGKEKNRFMTFEQYQIQQKLFHSQINPLGGAVWLELSRPVFDALIELCMMRLIGLPRPPEPEKPPAGDFPRRVLPEGSEFA